MLSKRPKQQLLCVSTLLSKVPPTTIVMFQYLPFKGAPAATLMCSLSTLLSEWPPTATVMCKYCPFKAIPPPSPMRK